MTRVFLVDENDAVLASIKAILEQTPGFTVLGVAADSQPVLAAIAQGKPDVICLAATLTDAASLPLVQQIMDQSPVPILIISSEIDGQTALINQLLAAGALDVLAMPKSSLGSQGTIFSKELLRKIKVLSGVVVFRRAQTQPLATTSLVNLPSHSLRQIVAIGASTGGPQAFEAVLSKLPANYPFPVICVQHISKGFLDPYIVWLNGKVKLPVSVARSGDKPETGQIYFAPDHANLELDKLGRFVYSHAPQYLHYPSIDATFHAIADYYANQVIAVLMTGMGNDGASGLKAIAQAGGTTIAQDEASSVVFGMPKVAIDTGAAQQVLNIEQIGKQLCKYAQNT